MAGKGDKEIKVEDNILVPKHSIMSEAEINEVLEKYNVTKKQLPIIKINDPAIAKFNPKAGDVVKIARDSPSQGKSVFYRVVVG